MHWNFHFTKKNLEGTLPRSWILNYFITLLILFSSFIFILFSFLISCVPWSKCCWFLVPNPTALFQSIVLRGRLLKVVSRTSPHISTAKPPSLHFSRELDNKYKYKSTASVSKTGGYSRILLNSFSPFFLLPNCPSLMTAPPCQHVQKDSRLCISVSWLPTLPLSSISLLLCRAKHSNPAFFSGA